MMALTSKYREEISRYQKHLDERLAHWRSLFDPENEKFINKEGRLILGQIGQVSVEAIIKDLNKRPAIKITIANGVSTNSVTREYGNVENLIKQLDSMFVENTKINMMFFKVKRSDSTDYIIRFDKDDYECYVIELDGFKYPLGDNLRGSIEMLDNFVKSAEVDFKFLEL